MGTYARVVVLAGLLITASARAQSASDSVHKLTGSGVIGLVNAAGNTDVTTLNAGEELSYIPALHYHLAQTLSIVYGRTDGVTTASLWQANLRGDRDFGPRWGAYALLEFDRNTFASIDRRFQEGVGVIYHALNTPTDMLDAEAGLGVVQTRLTSGFSTTHPIARLAGDYRHTFKPKTYVKEMLEILPDLQVSQDLRINSTTSLVAPLFKNVALKASYVVNFNNNPEAGLRKADRFLTTGVQFTF
jgi:putative salt-induced outer membrane protein YdiY